MTFRELSTFFERVEGISSRLEMTDILAKLFSKCSNEEAAIVCYLVSGRVAPMFIPAEFNVAEKSLLRVLEGVAAGAGLRVNVRKKFEKSGDLGTVASELVLKIHGEKSPRSRSLELVYTDLWKIAGVSGTGSVEIRDAKIAGLIGKMGSAEAKYVMRILSQKMRLGSSSKTILDALSVAKHGDKRDREAIERAFGVSSDLGYVASVYLKGGEKRLERIEIIPGVPVASMLVEREKDAEAIMKRMPKAIVQPKYDGLRCQIHIGVGDGDDLSDRMWWKFWEEASREDSLSLLSDGGERQDRVRLFSRNLEDMTEMFPDVVEAAAKLKVKSAILDAEVVGYNESTGECIPFQETMVRKRKYGIGGAVKDVPVKIFVFDALYVNGKNVMDVANEKRIAKLGDLIGGVGEVEVTGSPVVDSASELQEVFDSSVGVGLEGVVVKDPSSLYQPGKRGFDWIKLKRASQGHLADTVDVVILGYYFGKGRQAHFGIGAILGGVYDADLDRFVSLAKIGTGMTDEQWQIIKKDLDKHAVPDKPKRVEMNKGLYPDQWVQPAVVATVEADEITKSPNHTAGRGADGVGYALRFPRLKEWKRDRGPEDSTRVKEIVDMYGMQGGVLK